MRPMSQPAPEPSTLGPTDSPAASNVGAAPSYIFNVNYVVKVAPNPNPQTRGEQFVALTLDSAFSKFRAKFPDAEVTLVQRQGAVNV